MVCLRLRNPKIKRIITNSIRCIYVTPEPSSITSRNSSLKEHTKNLKINIQHNILNACKSERFTVANTEQVLFFQKSLKYEDDDNFAFELIEIKSCTELQENHHSFIPVIKMKARLRALVGNRDRREPNVTDRLLLIKS